VIAIECGPATRLGGVRAQVHAIRRPRRPVPAQEVRRLPVRGQVKIQPHARPRSRRKSPAFILSELGRSSGERGQRSLQYHEARSRVN